MLTKILNYKGYWFINESEKIFGELIFNPESQLLLKLQGSFHRVEGLIIGNVSEKFIYGISEDGKKITLLDCTRICHSFNSNTKYSLCTFWIDLAFIGFHLKNDDLNFSAFKFRLKNFDSWYEVSGIEFKDIEINEFAVSYKRPNPIEIKIGDIDCSFLSGSKAKTEKSNVSISEYSYIQLSRTSNFEIEEVFYYIGKFKSFLAMMTYEPTFLIELILINNQIVHNSKCRKGKTIDIEVLVSDINFYQAQKLIFPHNMLFSYKQIIDQFEVIINRWFKFYEDISPSFNLLFYSFRKSDQFSEEFFMDMARAIEIWHRRTTDSHMWNLTRFEKFTTKLISYELLDEDERSLLKEILEYANEPRLRQRLKDVYLEYGFIFDYKKREKSHFINDVINSRNYYTHYNSIKKNDAKRGVELFNLAIKLRALLISAILSKLGLNPEQIKERVKKIILNDLG